MTASLTSKGGAPADGRGPTLDSLLEEHGCADARAMPAGVTLGRLAEAKRLPEQFLRDQGLVDDTYPTNGSAAAIKIPYWRDRVHGEELTWRMRLSLSGADRFRSARDRPLVLYGLWRLNEAREAGWCLVVEGETDALTAWYAGLPCIGIPGAAAWKEEWSSALAGLELVVVREPDEGGATLIRHLAGSALSSQVKVVDAAVLGHLAGGRLKDVSDLWQMVGDRELFREIIRKGREAAIAPGAPRRAGAQARQAEMDDIVLGLEASGELDPDLLKNRERVGIEANGGAGLSDRPALRRRIDETLEEFLGDVPHALPWLVDRMVSRGTFMVAFGQPVSFKSMAMLHLGLLLAGGHQKWLGRTVTGPAPFIYVTNEKSRASAQSRLQTMIRSLGSTGQVRIVHRRIGSFEDQTGWAELVELSQSLGAPLIVLDTLASIAGPDFDENSGRAMATVIARRLAAN